MLPPKVWAAYTHLRTTVAEQACQRVLAHLEHAVAVRALRGQQQARTLKARARIVRSYLVEVDPLLSDASLVDTLPAAGKTDDN